MRDETCEQVISEFTPEDAVQEVEKLIKDIGMDIHLSKQELRNQILRILQMQPSEYMSGALILIELPAERYSQYPQSFILIW